MLKINITFTSTLHVNPISLLISKKTSPWELMDPRTKNDSDKAQDIRIPFDPLTAHKTRYFDKATSMPV